MEFCSIDELLAECRRRQQSPETIAERQRWHAELVQCGTPIKQATTKGVNRFDSEKLKEAIQRVKNPTRHTGFRLTQSGDTRQEFPVKHADNWLQRYLALYAARDAANMTNPQGDAVASKLGGPLSLGLSEAISNKLSLGDTKAERRDTLRSAVDDVEDSTYGEAAMRGLKSSLPYILAGGLGGVAHSAVTPLSQFRQKGPQWDTRRALTEGAVGAGTGLGLAVLRPLLQKLILDNVSNKAKRKAIAIKADMPTATSLPFGDAVAAAIHPDAK